MNWEDHHFAILDPFSWEDKGRKIALNESMELQACFMDAAQILFDGDIFSFYKPYKYVNIPKMMDIHRIASQGNWLSMLVYIHFY